MIQVKIYARYMEVLKVSDAGFEVLRFLCEWWGSKRKMLAAGMWSFPKLPC